MIYFSGAPLIIRECFQRNKVTIILFHELDYKIAKKALNI